MRGRGAEAPVGAGGVLPAATTGVLASTANGPWVSTQAIVGVYALTGDGGLDLNSSSAGSFISFARGAALQGSFGDDPDDSATDSWILSCSRQVIADGVGTFTFRHANAAGAANAAGWAYVAQTPTDGHGAGHAWTCSSGVGTSKNGGFASLTLGAHTNAATPGYYLVQTSAAAQMLKITNDSKIGFYAATPVVRASAITAVAARTDSSGGTNTGALEDVGVVPDQAKINSNDARNAADIVLLRAQVDALALACKNIGITS